jgi:dihydropteroate synthase
MTFRLPVGIMGVINVTPDSFSDGGERLETLSAVEAGVRMRADGADIIDIGGESTRPGAAAVPVEIELQRVIPVVRELANSGIFVSVDTTKKAVAEAAIDAGAKLINDVTGFSDPEMRKLAADAEVHICIMHMQGEPRTMQRNPRYDDVVSEVREFLADRAARCEEAGIEKEKIIVDPGIGFGKTVGHNLELLRNCDAIADLGYPLLIGVSRKSFIGKITDVVEPRERVAGSVAAALFAASKGARILRVHDVAESVQAVTIWETIASAPRRSSLSAG